MSREKSAKLDDRIWPNQPDAAHPAIASRLHAGCVIAQGADVNKSRLATGESPLHAALATANRQDHDAVLRVLLAHGANPNCVTKPSVATDHFMSDCWTKRETLPHRAAAFGTEATIQMLLDAGARIEAQDMNGDSALSWASWYLRPRVHSQKALLRGISCLVARVGGTMRRGEIGDRKVGQPLPPVHGGRGNVWHTRRASGRWRF